jgi:uncharacterized membrane protein
MLRRIRLPAGAALSAGLKYLFHPRGGMRRGAVIRAPVSSLAEQRARPVDIVLGDAQTRPAGQLTRIQSWIVQRSPIDPAIAEWIAGKLWTTARRPGAIRIGAALAIVGFSLLVRSHSNRRAAPRFGRGAITIRKLVDVVAPVHEVFEFWRRYQNWPEVIPRVREVGEIALDRHRWTIAGPQGDPIEWITVITKFGADRIIQWETVPGSVVEHAGSIRFSRNRNGTTRVDITLSYVPPPGPAGDAMAALFRSERNTVMNKELARLKSLLEQGQSRAEGGAL